tara:strand:- start:249 stop:407 length:159 start_codon:yes stop_codon:yes gene_type:complete
MNEDYTKNSKKMVDEAYRKFFESRGMVPPPVCSAGVFSDYNAEARKWLNDNF